MDFHMVDMLIVGLILFLAIRGLMNGFSKELFNFLALVGGVAVAARTHTVVAEFINEQQILPAMNVDFQKFVGFIVALAVIWIVLSLISSIITQFTAGESGVISRFLGYILGVARYLFIFSLIIFGVSNSQFLRENLSQYYTGSQLFEPMSAIGAKLINMDVNQTVFIGENSESNLTNEIHTIGETNVSTEENSLY